MKNKIFERFDSKELFLELEHRGRKLSPDVFKEKKIYVLTDVNEISENISSLGKVIKSTKELNDKDIKNSVFYIYFTCDSDAYADLERITKLGGTYIPHLFYGKTEYRFVDRLAYESLIKTWAKEDRVSHLDINVHENICEALHLTKNIEGDYVEIGVYLGGSALTALNYLELQGINKKAWLLDTYDGFNYLEAENSSDFIWSNTHQLYGVNETMNHIQKTLNGSAIKFELIQSNICTDTLPNDIKKISVANVDVDMYEPTLDALFKCSSKMSQGGIIICEDPTSTPGLYGGYLAMHQFLNSEKGNSYQAIFKKGSYFLIKVK